MNAALITMDAATSPETPARFAPRKLARKVELVSDDEDAQLMLAYASGEMRAFETLYSRHRAALYRYLVRQARDGEIANDLFQEVWSRVIANRARYEPRAKFRTFLRVCLDRFITDPGAQSKVRTVLDEVFGYLTGFQDDLLRLCSVGSHAPAPRVERLEAS